MDAKWVVSLQGKDYPLYGGVLAEAHERGLQSIVTRLIQIPDEGNGHTAIVEATITMKDGATFTDIGDASPKNVNAKIATALIRMASTRAKGRAMRDAVDIGTTLFEELPDLDDEKPRAKATFNMGAEPRAEFRRQDPPRPAARYEPGTPEGDAAMAGRRHSQSGFSAIGDVTVTNCAVCSKPMTAAQVLYCETNKITPAAHAGCSRRGA